MKRPIITKPTEIISNNERVLLEVGDKVSIDKPSDEVISTIKEEYQYYVMINDINNANRLLSLLNDWGINTTQVDTKI